MPAHPAPLAGRRNCSRCTRWRPVIDFPPGRTRLKDGTPLDPPQASSWCDPCRRRAARERGRRRYAEAKARRAAARHAVLTRARRRVERGEAVWAGPFREWAVERAGVHGWLLLALWAGLDDEARLRRAVRPEALTVPIDVVDRCLLWEGTARLDDLYPLEAGRHAGAPPDAQNGMSSSLPYREPDAELAGAGAGAGACSGALEGTPYEEPPPPSLLEPPSRPPRNCTLSAMTS
jgi:hypothetical protein